MTVLKRSESKGKVMLLIRRYKDTHTEGKLIYPDDSYTRTLEKVWADNKMSVSCIPEGSYVVKRDKTGRHQWYAIQDVPDRTYIEIHPANKESQLEGCIAPCMTVVGGVGKESRQACEKLLSWFGDSSFILTIRKYNPFRDGKW